MSAPIVRDMPYTTMLYHSGFFTPVVASEIPIGSSPLVDGTFHLDCEDSSSENGSHALITVNRDVELYFKSSGQDAGQAGSHCGHCGQTQETSEGHRCG